MQLVWLVELVEAVRPHLPDGFRVYVGAPPYPAIDPPPVPSNAVTPHVTGYCHHASVSGEADRFRPTWSGSLRHLLPERCVYVERNGRLAAVIELLSPWDRRGKWRRTKCLSRMVGYLTNGVQLLLVDVHPETRSESLSRRLNRILKVGPFDTSTPHAISYRISPADKMLGRDLDINLTSLVPDELLPTVPLAIGYRDVVSVDLEASYRKAAELNYLA